MLLLLLRLLTVAGTGLLAIRWYRCGFYRRYRVFFIYLIFSTCRSAILLKLNVRSGLYAWVWVFSEPLLWVFYFLLVLELYSLVLEGHQGVYTLGRWALYGALAVSVVLSAFSLIPSASGSGVREVSNVLNLYYLIERGVVFSLVIFIFLMLLFLTRYPVPLSRNVLVHSLVYSLYFLSITMGWLVRSVLGFEVTRSVSTFFSILSVACVIGWLTLITREGEAHRTTLYHRWEPGQEERLVGQLDAINSTLLRMARK